MTTSLTHQWISDHWHTVSPQIHTYLTAKFPISAKTGQIDLHVSNFVENLLRNESLDPHLEAGKEIRVGVLKAWAWQRTANELKKWGKDASLRASCGATTTANRDGYAPPTVTDYHRHIPRQVMSDWRYHTQQMGGLLTVQDPHRSECQGAYVDSDLDPEERAVVLDFLAKFRDLLCNDLVPPTPRSPRRFLLERLF